MSSSTTGQTRKKRAVKGTNPVPDSPPPPSPPSSPPPPPPPFIVAPPIRVASNPYRKDKGKFISVHGIRVRSDEALQRLHAFDARFATGRCISLSYLHDIDRHFHAIGLDCLVYVDSLWYPRLCAEFYSNMYEIEDHSFRTVVAGQDYMIDVDSVVDWLDLGGHAVQGDILRGEHETHGGYYPGWMRARIERAWTHLMDRDLPNPFKPDRLFINQLSEEMGFLAKVLWFNIYPKMGRENMIGPWEQVILSELIRGTLNFNVPLFLITNMITRATAKGRPIMPFCLLLSRFFRSWGIDLSSEVSLPASTLTPGSSSGSGSSSRSRPQQTRPHPPPSQAPPVDHYSTHPTGPSQPDSAYHQDPAFQTGGSSDYTPAPPAPPSSFDDSGDIADLLRTSAFTETFPELWSDPSFFFSPPPPPPPSS